MPFLLTWLVQRPLVIGTDVLKPIEDGGRLVKLDDGWGWARSGGLG